MTTRDDVIEKLSTQWEKAGVPVALIAEGPTDADPADHIYVLLEHEPSEVEAGQLPAAVNGEKIEYQLIDQGSAVWTPPKAAP